MINGQKTNALSRLGSSIGAGIGGSTDVGLIFNVIGGDSSIANLSSTLSINSTTVAAALRLEGSDAGASSWAPRVGATSLSLSGSGSAPTLGVLSPLTATTDTGVQFAQAKYYEAGSTSAYDVATATDDVVYECVFQFISTGTEQCLFSKYDTATGKGYLTVITAAAALQSYGVCAHSASGTLVDKAFYHLLIIADRNGNNRAYLNGTLLNSTANLNNAQTNTQALKVGAYGASAAGKSGSTILLAQLWIAAAGTVGSTGDSDIVAATRFHQMCGTYPIYAAGSYVPTFTRASVAYLDRPTSESTGVRQIFKVGAGWPRICRRQDTTSLAWANYYLSEGSCTNRFLQSNTFSNASWTKSNCSVASGQSAPDGSTLGWGVTPAVGTSVHAVAQTVAASSDTISVWAKAGANQYMGIITDATAASYAIFDVVNGTVASTGGTLINAQIVSYGNGWYLCSAGPGTLGTSQVGICTTNSSTSLSYNEASGASVGTYIFGAVSNNSTQRYAQSYVETTTAAAARQADALSFVSASSYTTQPGAIKATIMLPSSSSMASSQGIVNAYTDASNQALYAATTAGVLSCTVINGAATQVSASGSSALRDATNKNIIISYATNNFKANVGSTSEVTDTSCTFPSATTLYVGTTQTGLPLFGCMTRLKLYSSTKL